MWPAIVCAIVIVCIVVAYLLFHFLGNRSVKFEVARKTFFERREWLEADFMKLGAQSGRPRGLEWSSGDFGTDVEFARDKKSKHVLAFVSVSLKFEAIEGGGMEDVAAVANEKAATAVFSHDGKEWKATGKTVFNHSPSEAIQFYRNEIEAIS